MQTNPDTQAPQTTTRRRILPIRTAAQRAHRDPAHTPTPTPTQHTRPATPIPHARHPPARHLSDDDSDSEDDSRYESPDISPRAAQAQHDQPAMMSSTTSSGDADGLREAYAQLRSHNADLEQRLEEYERRLQAAASRDSGPPQERDHEREQPATQRIKRPQEINAIPMLSSLTDATAYGKWRRAWSHQIKLLAPRTDRENQRIALWMCAHTTDDAATLLQDSDTPPATPDQVFQLIREAAKQRVPVTERTLNLGRISFQAGETPRMFANRLLDMMQLFGISDEQILPFVREACREAFELRIITKDAKSLTAWLSALVNSGDADTPVRPQAKPVVAAVAADDSQVAAVAPRSSGTTHKSTKPQFRGTCWACQKPNHRASECRNKVARKRYEQQRAARAASTSAAAVAGTAASHPSTPN